MTAVDAREITEPGVYDLPADLYHRDPVPGGSLSASGARRLLPPSCPALYRYAADHPAPPSRAFDLGHAAHRLVLGAGPDLVVVDAEDWRTRAAREIRDQAYADDAVPLLAAEYETVMAMAAAIEAHPVAANLLSIAGQPERSLFWIDPDTGIWRRARLDWLPYPAPRRRTLLWDYKTCRTAAPDALSKAIHEYGYHTQAATYIDAVTTLGLAADTAYLLIAQEKTAPYLVTVVELDAMAIRIGRAENRRALNLYARCVADDHWPAYSEGVELLGVPGWVERRYLEDPS